MSPLRPRAPTAVASPTQDSAHGVVNSMRCSPGACRLDCICHACPPSSARRGTGGSPRPRGSLPFSSGSAWHRLRAQDGAVGGVCSEPRCDATRLPRGRDARSPNARASPHGKRLLRVVPVGVHPHPRGGGSGAQSQASEAPNRLLPSWRPRRGSLRALVWLSPCASRRDPVGPHSGYRASSSSSASPQTCPSLFRPGPAARHATTLSSQGFLACPVRPPPTGMSESPPPQPCRWPQCLR